MFCPCLYVYNLHIFCSAGTNTQPGTTPGTSNGIPAGPSKAAPAKANPAGKIHTLQVESKSLLIRAGFSVAKTNYFTFAAYVVIVGGAQPGAGGPQQMAESKNLLNTSKRY